MGRSSENDMLQSALAAARTGRWEWNPKRGGLLPDGIFLELFGLAADTGPAWSTLRPLVDEEDLSRLLAAAVGGRIATELRIRRPDGSRRILEVRGGAIDGSSGRPRQMAGIVYDVTEQRHAQVASRRFRQASEAAFRARNRLLDSLYPEIRTPLIAVLGGLDFMLDSDLPEEQRHCIDLARQAAGSLQRLIDDLVEYSRLQSGGIELARGYFNLDKCIKASLEALLPTAEERGVGLKMKIAGRVPETVIGDPQRLRQILSILMRIAVEHAEGGDVAVEVETGQPEELEETTEVVITVTVPALSLAARMGNGMALPRRRADDPPPSGTDGIAMAICRTLLERMAGSIDVHAEEEGTVVTLKVPFGVSQPEEKGGKVPRILLAEDDPIIRELLEISLRKRNWQTVSAENGQKALAEWRKGKFDLLLIDVQMPEVDGLEVARTIREQEQGTGSHVPIIAITAHARDEDRTSCLAAGMDDYLSKPIRMGDLYQVVMRQLNSRGSKH